MEKYHNVDNIKNKNIIKNIIKNFIDKLRYFDIYAFYQ